MSITSRFMGLAMVGLVSLSASAWATSPATVQGTVKDANGQVLKNADVKVEAKDGFTKVVKTDAKGHYVQAGLTAGTTYRVTLIVGGAVKASINNVKTTVGDPTDLNFDLKKASVSSAAANGKKKTHMVYVPSQTGSNLGGRWVEVDDQTGQEMQGMNKVQHAGASAVGKLQSSSSQQTGSGN
jgi:Carboxypeptidase regulatory-like domain